MNVINPFIRIFSTLFLVLVSLHSFGQTTTENYVKTTVFRDENGQKPVTTITYYDGLGRPIEQILNGQSATGKNIVTPIDYDDYGRQVKEYLPYATQTNDMSFIPLSTALTDQASFPQYSGQTAYSEKLLEASPLNRVFKQAAPGNPWAMGSGHEIKMDYQTNTTADQVKLFRATATWNPSMGVFDISLSATGTADYPEGELYKTITKDENWTSGTNNTVEEFKDKEGKVILKRTYNNGAHDTYYVYDQYGNLTYVLPPKAEGNASSNNLDNLGYQYKYDIRNRMVEKKLPGKQWEYIVYDKLDRVVATGPAFDPFGGTEQGWLITKYDALNRPVYTGWTPGIFSSAARKSQQDIQNNANVMNESRSTSTVTIDNVQTKYTNSVEPTIFTLLTVTYYDDYNFPHAIPSPDPDYIVTAKSLTTGTWTRVLVDASTMAAETTVLFYDKKYRAACSFSRHHTHGYTKVNTVYDFEGKVLETQTFHKYNIELAEINYKDTFTYTDQGRLDTHIQQIGNLQPQLIAKNVYDELGQLVSKQVGGTDVTTFLGLQKVDYQYNIRGWLTQINNIDDLNDVNGPRDLFSFKINYDNPDLSDGETTAGLYNGNIAQTLWHSDNDDIIRKYGYVYDALNRLTNATFFKDNTLYNSFDETLSYDKNGNIMSLLRTGYVESQYVVPVIDNLTYDYAADSNLLKGVEDSTGSPIGFNDTNASLVDYTYDANGNMITDANKDITGISYNHLNLPTLINFGNGNTIRYIYNAAGVKLRKDVQENNTHTITDYLAGHQYRDGKLGFFPHTEGYVNVHYCSNCTLEAQQAPKFNYVFQYRDHLGNIRMNYGYDEAEQVVKIMEEDHYYPFGLKHMNYNMDKGKYEEEELQTLSKIAPVLPTEVMAYKYKMNGKEWQDELGLNAYDFGARMYMPDIGRWPCIDPQAELLERSSPYVYALNSPLVYVDNDGELPILINGKTMDDSERADVSYWTTSIVNTIKNSGIANPGGEVHYVDGNRGHSWSGKVGGYATKDDNVNSPSRRAQGGRYAAEGDWKSILSKLARDPKTGKIIEKIQIYTHSRGAAFGVGYTEKLLELIKENSSQFADPDNVIDFVYNMAPHQSDFLTAPDGVDSYSMDHNRDKLSDNDMEGVKGAFSSDEKSKGFFGAHSITSFQNDLKAFTSSFLKGGSSQDVINNFIKTMKDKYGVTVTVQQ